MIGKRQTYILVKRIFVCPALTTELTYILGGIYCFERNKVVYSDTDSHIYVLLSSENWKPRDYIYFTIA